MVLQFCIVQILKGLYLQIERQRDIGTVVSSDENYALVFFPLSGYVAQILFSSLALTELELPVGEHNQEQALAEYKKRKVQ